MTAPRKPRPAANKKPRPTAKKKPRKTTRKKAAAKKSVTKKVAKKKAPTKKALGKATKAKKAARKAPSKKTAKKAAPKKTPARKGAPRTKAKKAKATRKPKLTSAQRTLALVEKVLDEHQADDIAVVDLTGKTAMADYMVVASGRNPRHIGAMADRLKSRLKTPGGRPPPVEGSGSTDWVLVDAGDVIVHLFRPEVRGLYNLEKIWGPEWASEPEEE